MCGKTLFLLFLLVHFIVWAKVATDTFLIFAMFLCLRNENQYEYEDEYEDENEAAVVLAPIT